MLSAVNPREGQGIETWGVQRGFAPLRFFSNPPRLGGQGVESEY
jgi:hypothetical protein